MSQVKTGLGGGTVTLGNKGAVGLRFKIKLQAQRSLTLCFVCSHLAAHRKDVEARNRDWNVTNETMRFDLCLDSMMHDTASKKKEDEMTLWEFAAARFSEMPYVYALTVSLSHTLEHITNNRYSNGKDSRYEYIKAKIRERWGKKSINKTNKARLKTLAINRGRSKRSSSLSHVVSKMNSFGMSKTNSLEKTSLDLSMTTAESPPVSPLPPTNRSISLGTRLGGGGGESPSTRLHSKASLGNIQLAIEDHDLIFWFGDLNYRIGMEMNIEDVFKKLDDNSIGSIQHLLKHDQLINERQKDNVFVGYEEGQIRFKPTYKYAKNTVTYVVVPMFDILNPPTKTLQPKPSNLNNTLQHTTGTTEDRATRKERYVFPRGAIVCCGEKQQELMLL